MKIFLGSDHKGFGLKGDLISYLQINNFEVVDLGATSYDENDDYSDFGIKVAEEVSNDSSSLGIVICGTGIGVCIAANKVKGIRCGLCGSVDVARLARKDDNINVLALSSELHNDLDIAVEIVNAFVETKFDNSEKRVRRVEKIATYENSH